MPLSSQSLSATPSLSTSNLESRSQQISKLSMSELVSVALTLNVNGSFSIP